MTTLTETSGKRVSPSLIFAAGTFVGAIAVSVSLTSAGNPTSSVGGSGLRTASATSSPAPAAGPNFLWWIGDDPRSRLSSEERNGTVEAASASPTKQDLGKANVVNNETVCDVQLD